MSDNAINTEPELSIKEALLYLKDKWLLIFSLNFFSCLVLIAYALSLPNIYSSTSKLIPTESANSGTSTLASLASRYGNISQAIGLDFGGGGNKVALAVAILSSRTFFEKHIYEKVLVDLMAVKGWDNTKNQLEYNVDIYDPENDAWKVDTTSKASFKPSKQRSYEAFLGRLSINDETKHSGFLHITTEHFSPYVAKKWNSLLIKSINEEVRSQDIEMSQNAVNFLLDQIQSTKLASLESLFANLIEEQTKTIMLAKVSRNYVFNLVEKPFVEERKSKPNRARLCVIGAIIIFAFSLILVLLRGIWLNELHLIDKKENDS